MATKTNPSLAEALDEEWETISTGIGEEIPLAEGQSFVGNYLGTTSKELKDPDTESGVRDQSVHQFAPLNDPNEVLFLWGSYELDAGLSKVQQGSKVKVTFTGYGRFNSDAGPRQIKHYKVQVAKS